MDVAPVGEHSAPSQGLSASMSSASAVVPSAAASSSLHASAVPGHSSAPPLTYSLSDISVSAFRAALADVRLRYLLEGPTADVFVKCAWTNQFYDTLLQEMSKKKLQQVCSAMGIAFQDKDPVPTLRSRISTRIKQHGAQHPEMIRMSMEAEQQQQQQQHGDEEEEPEDLQQDPHEEEEENSGDDRKYNTPPPENRRSSARLQSSPSVPSRPQRRHTSPPAASRPSRRDSSDAAPAPSASSSSRHRPSHRNLSMHDFPEGLPPALLEALSKLPKAPVATSSAEQAEVPGRKHSKRAKKGKQGRSKRIAKHRDSSSSEQSDSEHSSEQYASDTPSDSSSSSSDSDFAPSSAARTYASSRRRHRHETEQMSQNGLHEPMAKKYIANVLSGSGGQGSIFKVFKDDIHFKKDRNKRECLTLAKILDGIRQKDWKGVQELAVRRLAGVHAADTSENWAICDAFEMVMEKQSFVPPTFLQNALKTIQRNQALVNLNGMTGNMYNGRGIASGGGDYASSDRKKKSHMGKHMHASSSSSTHPGAASGPRPTSSHKKSGASAGGDKSSSGSK